MFESAARKDGPSSARYTCRPPERGGLDDTEGCFRLILRNTMSIIGADAGKRKVRQPLVVADAGDLGVVERGHAQALNCAVSNGRFRRITQASGRMAVQVADERRALFKADQQPVRGDQPQGYAARPGRVFHRSMKSGSARLPGVRRSATGLHGRSFSRRTMSSAGLMPVACRSPRNAR